MLASVGQKGYGATTVAEVVARAGVSRKAFYEHFAHKEECFLAAYDTIAKEGRRMISLAYRSAADRPDRMERAIQALLDAARENPAAMRLATTEIAAVGPAGIERRERAVLEYGELLHAGMSPSAAGERLPETTLRAIVGGLNRVLATYLRRGRRNDPHELVANLVRWISTYHPAPEGLHDAIASRRTASASLGGRAPGTLAPQAASNGRRGAARRGASISRSFVVQSQRERILDAVANLTAASGYAALTVEHIAAEAAISLQAFYEHFESKEDAFLVAYELGHAKGLDIVERAFAGASDWRTGVRDGLGALIDYLASEPSFAHLSLLGTLVATPRAAELSTKGLTAYGRLLAPGLDEARGKARLPEVAIEATAGGLHELFLHYAAQGRVGDITELTVDATYIALAPFIGAQAAVGVAIETAAPGPRRECRSARSAHPTDAVAPGSHGVRTEENPPAHVKTRKPARRAPP